MMRKPTGQKERYSIKSEISRVDSNDGTAARARPFSYDEIMHRRKNKKQYESVEDQGVVSETVYGRVESDRHRRMDVVDGGERHGSKERLKVVSRTKERIVVSEYKESYISHRRLRVDDDSAKDSRKEKGVQENRKNHDRLTDDFDYERKKRHEVDDDNDSAKVSRKERGVHENRKNHDRLTGDFDYERRKRHEVDDNDDSAKDSREERGVHEKRKNHDRLTGDFDYECRKRHEVDAGPNPTPLAVMTPAGHVLVLERSDSESEDSEGLRRRIRKQLRKLDAFNAFAGLTPEASDAGSSQEEGEEEGDNDDGDGEEEEKDVGDVGLVPRHSKKSKFSEASGSSSATPTAPSTAATTAATTTTTAPAGMVATTKRTAEAMASTPHSSPPAKLSKGSFSDKMKAAEAARLERLKKNKFPAGVSARVIEDPVPSPPPVKVTTPPGGGGDVVGATPASAGDAPLTFGTTSAPAGGSVVKATVAGNGFDYNEYFRSPSPQEGFEEMGDSNPLAYTPPEQSPRISSPGQSLESLWTKIDIPVKGKGEAKSSRYTPRWRVYEDSSLNDPAVCHDICSMSIPPAERVFQRDRSRYELLAHHESNVAHFLATNNEIVREWEFFRLSRDDVLKERDEAEAALVEERRLRKTAEWARADAEKSLAYYQKVLAQQKKDFDSKWAGAMSQLQVAREEVQVTLRWMENAEKEAAEAKKVAFSQSAFVASKDEEIKALQARLEEVMHEREASDASVAKLADKNDKLKKDQQWILKEGLPRFVRATVAGRGLEELMAEVTVTHKLLGVAEGFQEGLKYAAQGTPADQHYLAGTDLEAELHVHTSKLDTAKERLVASADLLAMQPSANAFKNFVLAEEAIDAKFAAAADPNAPSTSGAAQE